MKAFNESLNLAGLTHNYRLDEILKNTMVYLQENPSVRGSKFSADSIKDLIKDLIVYPTPPFNPFEMGGASKSGGKGEQSVYAAELYEVIDFVTAHRETPLRQIPDIGKVFTESEIRFFENLLALNYDTTQNEVLFAQISQLESEAPSARTESNSFAAMSSALSIAKHSAQYWNTDVHEQGWLKDLKDQNSNATARAQGPGGRIGEADVRGAITGAVGAAIVNAVPGAGQVAYGTAIVGAATAGSLLQGVGELGSWLGWW